MCETGSWTVIWNVQAAIADGIKPVLYIPFCKCMSPEEHYCIQGRWFVKERNYIRMNIVQFSQETIKACTFQKLCTYE